jgi:uroporphyrinogen III methyltransferase/synthase
VAGEELPRRLRGAGAHVDVLPLYRTVPHPDAPKEIPRLLRSGLDMVTFTSASAVKSLVAAVGPGFRRPPGLLVACIGPVTADAARAAGLDPDIVATVHTGAGLAVAIRDNLAVTADGRATRGRQAGAA